MGVIGVGMHFKLMEICMDLCCKADITFVTTELVCTVVFFQEVLSFKLGKACLTLVGQNLDVWLGKV